MTTDDRLGHLLRGLDPDQVRAVTSPAAVLRVVAGPGSGKTRVLTRRVAYRIAGGSADPARCLVVTFTRAAAEQLRRRLSELVDGTPVAASTFHAAALEIMRSSWADDRRSAPPIVDRGEFLARRARGGDRSTSPAVPSDPVVRAARAGKRDRRTADLSTEIGWARSRLVTPETYAAAAVEAGRTGIDEAESVAGAYGAYEEEKRRRGVVDLDDVVEQCIRAFGDRAFATAHRWRSRHLFVDELQDLTPLQFALLSAWTGDEPDLFAVGDPRQAVYAWNGSDPDLMRAFPRHFAGCETVTLTRNYRSSPAIVAVAGAVAQRHLPEADIAPSTDPGIPTDDSEGPVPAVHALDDAATEGTTVARILRLAHAAGTPFTSMAVLVRTNALADSLREHLAALQVDVECLTFHRAKGLQWRAVVVAGAEEGLLPYASSTASDTALAEEARLFYVAVTRAAHELHMVWCARRNGETRRPSRYLAAVEEICRRLAGEDPVVTADSARRRIRSLRAVLGAGGPGEDPR